MTDIKKEFEKNNLEKPSPEIASVQKESQENNEIMPSGEAAEARNLRQEVEAVAMDDGQKAKATQTAQDLISKAPEEKIRKLLLIAEEKGVVYAVNVAKKMNDPYLLDTFHDALAEKGFYKKFKK